VTSSKRLQARSESHRGGFASELRVRAVVSDLETAICSGVWEVVPGVAHRGCAFHLRQAVWRSVQAVGLQWAYTGKQINRICRKTMAVAFLTAYIVPAAFAEPDGANTDALVDQHLQ